MTPAEEQVRALAREITGQSLPEGHDAALLESGFDSLAFVELGAFLEERSGVALPHRADPVTVGDLLSLAEGATSIIDAPIVPVGLGRSQRMAIPVVSPLFRWFFQIKTVGAESIPTRGPVLVCLNHDSAIDVLVTGISAPRRIAIMGKEEIFLGPFVRWLFHEMGAFPVDRDQFDRRAVEVALAILDRGHALAMWPEGTRDANTLLPFSPGAAWIALHRGVPIVPGAVVGTGASWPRDRKLPRRHPVTVAFGEAIPVSRVDEPVARRSAARDLTTVLRGRIASLLREHGSPLAGLGGSA